MSIILRGLIGLFLFIVVFLILNGVAYLLHNRRRRRESYRRWRGAAMLVLPLLLLMPLAGCASTPGGGTDPQYQQFQAQVQFWTSETARLRAAVETMPPGKTRDDLVKQLTQAQYWLAFFNALVNPPTTQPAI